jgi:hypothetical protein
VRHTLSGQDRVTASAAAQVQDTIGGLARLDQQQAERRVVQRSWAVLVIGPLPALIV